MSGLYGAICTGRVAGRGEVSGASRHVSIEPGCLYVVATPIGHRDDISERARRVLAEVAVVAAEDTRRTGRLLKHLGITAEFVSLHEHNERERIPSLIERLASGASVALVSDAGTPGISDPGYPLVVAAHDAGIPVRAIPGPSAAMAALSVAGQPTDRFAFEGFLPAKASARRTRLQVLSQETRTLILFEAGHRIEATLADLVRLFGGERPATLARELTKAYETVARRDLAGLAEWVAAAPEQRRGEVVLVIAGAPAERVAARAPGVEEALDVLLAELPPTRAAAVTARLTGCRRRYAYDVALRRRGEA